MCWTCPSRREASTTSRPRSCTWASTTFPGSCRSALDQYAGVAPVSFSLVAGLIVLYLLLIGPVDYFLLRKLSPRMELTWVSFPLLVLAFAVAAYVLAYRFKGDEVRTNQVTLIDVDTESPWLRGTTWAQVFSPQMARYDLSCRAIPLGKEEPHRGELLFRLAGSARRCPGRHGHGLGRDAAPAVRDHSEPGCHARGPHPHLGQQELHRPLERPDGRLARGAFQPERSGLVGPRHQQSRFSSPGLPALLWPLGL